MLTIVDFKHLHECICREDTVLNKILVKDSLLSNENRFLSGFAIARGGWSTDEESVVKVFGLKMSGRRQIKALFCNCITT